MDGRDPGQGPLWKVKAPTSVLWGKLDAVTGGVRRVVPNATPEITDNCGHRPQMEKPAKFKDAMTSFLSGLS